MERVEGMPIRCVIIQRVEDESWIQKKFIPGQILELNDYDFAKFNEEHPGCMQEILMTKEDWIDLGTTRALECKKRIAELELLSGEKFSSYYSRVIPSYEGAKVDGSSYGGGLPDVYHKTHLLQEDVLAFERRIFSNDLSTDLSTGRHK